MLVLVFRLVGKFNTCVYLTFKHTQIEKQLYINILCQFKIGWNALWLFNATQKPNCSSHMDCNWSTSLCVQQTGAVHSPSFTSVVVAFYAARHWFVLGRMVFPTSSCCICAKFASMTRELANSAAANSLTRKKCWRIHRRSGLIRADWGGGWFNHNKSWCVRTRWTASQCGLLQPH